MNLSKPILVILGTARKDSNSIKAVRENSPFKNEEIVELHKFNLNHYQYDSDNRSKDDFLHIAEKMLSVQTIVFATPVYWYAMSGIMKIFFDRLTELISTSKGIGKSLAGKKVFLVATGSDPELPIGFEVPFKRTSDYFKMLYQEVFYYRISD